MQPQQNWGQPPQQWNGPPPQQMQYDMQAQQPQQPQQPQQQMQYPMQQQQQMQYGNGMQAIQQQMQYAMQPQQQMQYDAPPPPPPSANIWKKNIQPSQAVQDKNAAFIARMKAKQAAQKASDNPTTDFANDAPKKINLFGDNASEILNKAKIHKKKKRNKYVQLPDTGLTEKELFTKYKIESTAKIGAGAFARIKVIKDKSTGTQYALKMVKTKGKSTSDIEAFKKEMLFLSKLTNHPNIIKMYDFCESPHGLYMVLEFCNGGDVMQRMAQQRTFKEQEAKHLTKQIVAGLCYFHEFNIVHRDLKLDNLMFNNGVLKIIDFGLAGDCTDRALNTPCGTLHFTAPEVLMSYDYSTKADMWSLGVIIYMFICGFPPFFDQQGNEQKLFQLIKRAKFQFIPLYFKQCSECIQDLITQLLLKQPGQRMSAQQARNHEWLTGVKAKPKELVEVYNPFLNKTEADKKNDVHVASAPYKQYEQLQAKQSGFDQNNVNNVNMNNNQQVQNNNMNMAQYGQQQQQQNGYMNNMNGNQYNMNNYQYGQQQQQQQPGGGYNQMQYNQYQQQPGQQQQPQYQQPGQQQGGGW